MRVQKRCFYCGNKTSKGKRAGAHHPTLRTRDHLIPKRLRRISIGSLPPKQQRLFTVTCCYACNQKKGDKDPLEFAKSIILPNYKICRIEEAWRLNNAPV